MHSDRSIPLSVSRVALGLAFAAAAAFAAGDVHAQSREGRPSASHAGGKPGGGEGWRGGGNGNGRHWNGDRGGPWRGSYGRGLPWRGYYGHGGRYYYPGWTLGLGVGIGLGHPGWGWGYPFYPAYVYPPSVVYEGPYEAPVGVVIERDAPGPQPEPAYRWYCPSPPGYHPEVRECGADWLKVLPQDGAPPGAIPPPSTTPRSTAPVEESPIARGYAPSGALAQIVTQ